MEWLRRIGRSIKNRFSKQKLSGTERNSAFITILGNAKRPSVNPEGALVPTDVVIPPPSGTGSRHKFRFVPFTWLVGAVLLAALALLIAALLTKAAGQVNAFVADLFAKYRWWTALALAAGAALFAAWKLRNPLRRLSVAVFTRLRAIRFRRPRWISFGWLRNTFVKINVSRIPWKRLAIALPVVLLAASLLFNPASLWKSILAFLTAYWKWITLPAISLATYLLTGSLLNPRVRKPSWNWTLPGKLAGAIRRHKAYSLTAVVCLLSFVGWYFTRKDFWWVSAGTLICLIWSVVLFRTLVARARSRTMAVPGTTTPTDPIWQRIVRWFRTHWLVSVSIASVLAAVGGWLLSTLGWSWITQAWNWILANRRTLIPAAAMCALIWIVVALKRGWFRKIRVKLPGLSSFANYLRTKIGAPLMKHWRWSLSVLFVLIATAGLYFHNRAVLVAGLAGLAIVWIVVGFRSGKFTQWYKQLTRRNSVARKAWGFIKKHWDYALMTALAITALADFLFSNRLVWRSALGLLILTVIVKLVAWYLKRRKQRNHRRTSKLRAFGRFVQNASCIVLTLCCLGAVVAGVITGVDTFWQAGMLGLLWSTIGIHVAFSKTAGGRLCLAMVVLITAMCVGIWLIFHGTWVGSQLQIARY